MRGWCRLADPESDREPERAPSPRIAVRTDSSAQRLRQPLADGQSQAGAAVPPRRRRISLRKGDEQASLRFRRDADACVGDLDAQHRLSRAARSGADPHGHAAFLGELERVSGQVEEDLPKPPGIPVGDGRHVREDDAGQLEPPGMALLRERDRGRLRSPTAR